MLSKGIQNIAVFFFLSFLTGLAHALTAPEEKPVPLPISATLKELLDQNLDGLTFEEAASQKGKGAVLELEIEADDTATETKAERKSRRKRLSKKFLRLPKEMTPEFMTQLVNATPEIQKQTIKRIPDFESLLKMSVILKTKTPSCDAASTALLLGQKAEEYLPEEPAFNEVNSLYSMMVNCGPQTASSEITAEKARFRLSLLYVWKKKYAEATPLLTSLSNSKNRNYSLRALYWLQFIQKTEGKTAEAAITTMKIWSTQPFSFHSLLLFDGNLSDAQKILGKEDAKAELRTLIPRIDDDLRSIELFQRKKQFRKAAKLLNRLIALTPRQKKEFRLYLSVLKFREGDFQKSFQLAFEYLKTYPSHFSDSFLKLFFPKPYDDEIRRHEDLTDPLLVTALIRQESCFNPRARSRVGAKGLMQLMPTTLRVFSISAVKKIFQPETNIRFGSKFFTSLLERYNNQIELALAAYNAGPLKVDAWLKRFPDTPPALFMDLIPYAETREYVANIVRNYFWYRYLDKDKMLISKNANRKNLSCTLSKLSSREPASVPLIDQTKSE